MNQSRIKFNVERGDIEIEGTEEFVEKHLQNLPLIIKQLPRQQPLL